MTPLRSPSGDSVLETLATVRADGLSSNTKIPKGLIDAVARAGYEWHVWTVNEPASAKQMQALGARSITTDAPAVIKRALAR
ncbi:MAG: hypothetical protein GVY36_19405 [Verrucomicrobia bacterium]|jgi:glycerophosphoryl diester phosphodiesterase|nr:hypothetical protein [Verrucomicrobiota bacterium]